MPPPLKILKTGFKVLLLITFFGLAIYAWRSTNDHRLTQIHSLQLVREIGTLKKDIVEQQKLIENLRLNWEQKSTPLASKEDTSIRNRFPLKCAVVDDTILPDEQAILDMVEDQSKEGSVLQVCLNTETKGIVFMTEQARAADDSRITGDTRYYLYDAVAPGFTPEVTLLATEEKDVYFSCGSILYWTRSGGLYISCGGGDGGGVLKIVKRINLTNYKVEVVENCHIQSDGSNKIIETCSRNCGSSRDCAANQFCDLATNSCINTCKEEGKSCEVGLYLNGTCRGYGPVLGCKAPY